MIAKGSGQINVGYYSWGETQDKRAIDNFVVKGGGEEHPVYWSVKGVVCPTP